MSDATDVIRIVPSYFLTITKNASGADLTTTLPHEGYNKPTTTSFSHFKIKGVKDDGIYLTITKAGVVYVNNVKVSSTYGYPKSFNGVAAKNVASIFLDNIYFQTPAVAGFVATPTSEVTRADGTSRKFTLSCLTDGATIYYATSNLEKGAAGWIEYTGEVTTAATTIYAYAKDGEDNTSEKMNFATGAGTTIDLKPATITHSNNGVYTITSNQSTILGTPTATIHYQIDGGSEQTSTNASVNVNIATDGTLTYWLTADGYGATDPANETVYAAVGYAVTRTIDFKTSNDNDWAHPGEETTVTGDSHTYYLYKDQSDNLIAEDILATSFENGDQAWRIQRYKGGTAPYNKTEYIALKNLAKGQIVQFACTSAPSVVVNLTAVPASTYTGTYTYTATAAGDVIVSLAKDVVITMIKLCETSVSPAIASGYATFASDYALDFENATGVKAYYATNDDENDGKINMTLIEGSVPAGTGLFLQKVGGEAVSIPVVASYTTDVSANLLKRGTGAEVKSVENGITRYVLANQASGVGFYKLDTTTGVEIATNKAYLELPASTNNASRLAFVFNDGEATGIKNVAPVYAENEDAIYNLSGQRVSQPKKGLYVVGGKKVMVK